MIVQIYTAQTPEEGVALARAGVNHVGVTPSKHGLPGEIDLITAKQIFEAIGNQAVKVALTVDTRLDLIKEMVETVNPDILHLCGDISIMTPARVAELKKHLPPVLFMQAVPVVDRGALTIARQFEPVVDYFILDSFSKDIGGIGAAGFTHNWNLSREIVKQSRLPVILAGGLSPNNVAEAIRVVQPWGVDSLTHTNQPLGGGRFRKDMDRVKAFVSAAMGAAREITT